MLSSIYWVNLNGAGRLAIMARPRAGEWLRDEISAWQSEKIDVVVSLLEAEEVRELDLREEAEICRECKIDFLSFPIVDRGVPESSKETLKLVQKLSSVISREGTVIVHCRAGIGRSSLIAACILILLGYEANTALNLLSTARKVNVPDTDEQRVWISQFEKTYIASS